MTNRHIGVNIDTSISTSTGVRISQDTVARRAAAASPEPINKPLGTLSPPHFTSVKQNI